MSKSGLNASIRPIVIPELAFHGQGHVVEAIKATHARSDLEQQEPPSFYQLSRLRHFIIDYARCAGDEHRYAVSGACPDGSCITSKAATTLARAFPYVATEGN